MFARFKEIKMFKNSLNILLLLLAANSCNAQASSGSSQGGVTMFSSVEDIWHYADTHNITIRTANYEADKANLTKKQAYGALLPQASLGGSFTDNTTIQSTIIPGEIFGGPPGSYKAVQFGQKYIYSGTFSAQMDILNLQNIFNAQIAKRTEELNKATLANTRKTVYQQLATQFYSYLLMQEALRLTAESEMTADSVYQSVNNRYKEGMLSEANADVAKLNMERAEQTHITASYQMQIAKNNMKAMLGMELKDSLVIATSLHNIETVDDSKTFQQDPALRVSFSQLRIAQSQYRAANGAFAPTISLLYNTTTTQYDSTYRPFSTNEAPWFPATYWSVRATLPLFTGGSRYFQSKKTKINYLESKEQYENTLRQSAINDENIKLSYKKSAAVLAKAADIMKLGLDNYQHVSYKYEAGVSSLEERLKAFSDYIDYQNAYLNSLSDMLVQLYQLKIRQQSF